MRRPGSPPRATSINVVIGALLCVAGQLEVAGWWDLGGIGAPDLGASRGFEALLVLATTAPLLCRRRYPLAALATIAGGMYVQIMAVTPSVSLLAGLLPLLIATFTVAARSARTVRIVGLAVALAVEATFTAKIPEERAPNEVAFGLIVIIGSWLLGIAISHRLRRTDNVVAEAQRSVAAQQALAKRMVSDERARIARELHDVIAHGVSVMGVQSAAARLIMDRDPDRAKGMLVAVEDQARESIGELQRLLSVLRGSNDETDREPQPGLQNLPHLVETMRQAGLRVQFKQHGTAQTLPAGADLTAYRIVQEALTNTLKHAGPVEVSVRLRWAVDQLGIEVSDCGPRVTKNLLPGHGLVGMRERVALYGGTVKVAARPSGGITVEANLPVGAAAT